MSVKPCFAPMLSRTFQSPDPRRLTGIALPPTEVPALLSDAKLRMLLSVKAVRELRIVETPQGKYRLYVRLVARNGEDLLATVRGQPREWASLKTLARHLSTRCRQVPPIQLCLHVACSTVIES